ncbi:hypothetical protein BGX26_010877 [Mortierella sp. AD094]|nr:hypothetical protein BGX26_010877 [Mortierella sp. AD094]
MDLLRVRRLQKSSNCAVEVIWCVRDPDEVQWFQEELEVILDAAQGYLDAPEKDKEDIDLISTEVPETPLRILIHYTALGFCDQESIVVQAPTVPTSPAVGHISTAGIAASSTVTTAETTLNTPFAGDERVEWVKSRLNVIEHTRRQIEETPREKVLEIVGCGPALMLAELHNVVAATETLSGCRVNLHTERFHI